MSSGARFWMTSARGIAFTGTSVFVREGGDSRHPPASSTGPATAAATAKATKRGGRAWRPTARFDFMLRSVPDHRGAEVVQHVVDRVGDGRRARAGVEQAHRTRIVVRVLDHERAGVPRVQELAARVRDDDLAGELLGEA